VARLAVGLGNNSFEVHDVGEEGAAKVHTVDREGHRTDVRALALASDDSVMVTCSHEEVKVWNPSPSGAPRCLRSIESGYGLSAAFLPGDRHLLLGTKQGQLELFNVESGEALSGALPDAGGGDGGGDGGDGGGATAHKGEVWAVAVNPNGREVASAGADGRVRFWELQVAERGGRQTLALQPARTLELPEAVLCLQYSPDGKHIACGLLDSSIKVFFCDSLKFFLSMFGHRLPVLSLDISSDGALLASGSADKNIKIWGMDFGDCHKSLFAHPDSVTQVRFVRNTHYLFSAGKDGSVKYWDMDAREQLLTLDLGHHSACWALAVSALGDFVVTGGHDRALRRWDRTEEPFFLEEERERRLESLFEQGAGGPAAAGAGTEGAVAGEAGAEALTGTDRIIEALELAAAEEQVRAEPGGADRAPNPVLLGLSPSAYVLRAVRSVRAPDLEQALLLLPYTDALRVLEHCLRWLGAEEGAAKGSGGSPVEVAARVAALVVRLHLGRLSAAPAARELLTRLRAALRGSLGASRDLLGVNLAALAALRRP
jgi:U3 small nucleolar RNA-associated protein 12